MSIQGMLLVFTLAFIIDAAQSQSTPPSMVIPPLLTTPITDLTSCNSRKFDIVFVLDSSGSVGEDNFKVMKSFVKSIVQILDIGPDNTKVGLITFSRYPVLRLHLNDYTDKNALLHAIDTVPYIAGITETHSALYLLRDEGFKGSRPDVPKIAVVVTDGKSFHTNSTASASEDLQAKGVVMFGIGIGPDVNILELNSIASEPNVDHVYTLVNFASLSSIVNSLTLRTCAVTTISNVTTPEPVSTPAPTYINETTANGTRDECNRTVADIAFVLDSSGSLGILNFEKVKQFVINIVNFLDIGVNYTKVGVITYSNYPTRRINLDSFLDKLDLINAINQIPYYPGNTETDKALDLLRLEGWEGERKDAPDIAIVVTDGLSTNPDLTNIAASRLLKSGAVVFAVGIGQDIIDRNELNIIASNPDNEFVYFVANFSELSSIENNVARTTCLVPLMTTTVRTVPTTPISTEMVTPSTMKPTVTLAPLPQSTIPPQTTTPSCVARVADVVFVLDSSGSVGEDNFLKIKEFVKQTVRVFDIGVDYTRVGIITFSNNAKLEFQLNTYNNSQDILAAIDSIVYSQGGTNTAEALELLRLQGFNYERQNDPNIAIVITDGRSKDKIATRQQAMLAKQNANTTIIAIGIGNGTDVDELRDIATQDQSGQSLIYEVGDFEALQTLDSVVATVACGLVVVVPPITTTVGTTVATVPTDCFDTVENCEEYGDDICYDYKPWANAHCQLHCGFCRGPATTPSPCENKKPNCPEYGTYICTSVALTQWTKANCPKYCGFCGGGAIPTEAITIATTHAPTRAPVCRNEIENCKEYGGKDMCHQQSYEAWAKSHCAEYCGFCSDHKLYKGQTLLNNVTCPDWNLPISCTLDQQADSDCCPMPNCPQGFTLTAKSALEL